MNKEFLYYDGRYVLLTDAGLKSSKDYYDNLEEVLLLENEKEQIENQINVINENNAHIDSKRPIVLPFLVPIISISTMRVLLPILFDKVLNYNYDNFQKVYIDLLNVSINSLDLVFIATAVSFGTIGLLYSLVNAISNKIDSKKIDNNYEEIVKLRTKINELSKRIKELKKDNSLTRPVKYNDNDIINLCDDKVKQRILKRN
jgi:hypothetical protein